MKHKLLAVALCSVVFIAGCQTNKITAILPGPQLSPDQLNIKKLLYSEFIDKGSADKIYLLPEYESQEIFHYFAGHIPVVKDASNERKDRRGNLIDRDTGKPAISIEVAIGRIQEKRADATVSLCAGPIGAETWTYTLKKTAHG